MVPKDETDKGLLSTNPGGSSVELLSGNEIMVGGTLEDVEPLKEEGCSTVSASKTLELAKIVTCESTLGLPKIALGSAPSFFGLVEVLGKNGWAFGLIFLGLTGVFFGLVEVVGKNGSAARLILLGFTMVFVGKNGSAARLILLGFTVVFVGKNGSAARLILLGFTVVFVGKNGWAFGLILLGLVEVDELCGDRDLSLSDISRAVAKMWGKQKQPTSTIFFISFSVFL
ncbi:MAG: hypothetical protein LBT70_04210 [Holosporaceae bacterium]|jgi:predicted transcriptional regulator with HTH domain|nr:hypothetical protein [Holosporaceae bacterium]